VGAALAAVAVRVGASAGGAQPATKSAAARQSAMFLGGIGPCAVTKSGSLSALNSSNRCRTYYLPWEKGRGPAKRHVEEDGPPECFQEPRAYAGRTMRERRIRAELDKLITAIEAYHAKFNQYPPDNFDPVAKTVNPVTNSLYYELTGVIADDRGGGRFRLANRQQWIGTQQVQQYFHTDGFVNSGTSAKEIKQFAEFKAEQHKAIASMPADLEVLTVPVDWPLNNPKFPPPFDASTDPKVKRINPVRYVGHPHATNNPDGFDLWAEYVDGGRRRIICNWSKDIL